MASAPKLLTDPFLQLPTLNSINVVWFTEFIGVQHLVTYGENLAKKAVATTVKLSRTREDQKSRVANQSEDGQVYKEIFQRDIWRHEALISNLTPGIRINYQVTSIREDGESVSSDIFTLAAAPNPGVPKRILLTSDHQIKPMVAANLQKVVETVGQVDAVWFAGDLVNISDRASEWFDDNRGNAFFPCLQGRANYEMNHDGVKLTYYGGEIIQHAPMYTCIGNHELMGRFNGDQDKDQNQDLNNEFNDTIPRSVARQLYGEKSIKDNSFNTDTYEEIFSLPKSLSGGKTYYAVTWGDVRLVVLYATNMWRSPNTDKGKKGKYAEASQDLENPENWGYGQIIYEPISKGSTQYNWLVEELNNAEFQQAKYKVVMLHHPPHTLGDNIVPAYTDPVQVIQRDENDKIKSVSYEYPKDNDYLMRDVMPLLETAKVQLVFFGHSHLWNRFISSSGMHFLETSNVGNSYGAAFGSRQRDNVPTKNDATNNDDYVEIGDPNGLYPVVPTISPLVGEDNQPIPFISSNKFTVFSIFDTGTGEVSSYRFDTSEIHGDVVKFDVFRLT
ncbi:purple acid phosphatase family protein [Calothrix sp. PCC 6303]|uniref:purple acid phosphatase family protein n=1 Tax=Calothrix sp. PCC 6303 TaxID=1170562 RepID=UPI0002A03483|nr:metallophosphoesterase family protein [Calothrix sp. PCC 6303]AFZ04035.1 metallophosphoesterase [Calothrix sp. PCC 6303]